MSRVDVRDGTLLLENNDDDSSGNQGTSAVGKREVDLSAAKEKPIVKVSYSMSRTGQLIDLHDL